MGSLFKKQYTKPMPPGAEVIQRNGQRVARWKSRGKTRTALVTRGEDDADRLLFDSKVWYGRYRDHNGLVVERSTECRDESAARQVLARWERDAERIKSGVMTPGEDQMSRQQSLPIKEHFDAYDRSLQAGGVTQIHRSYTRRYLDRLAEECAFARLSDLRRESLERWLAARAGEGIAAKTRNIYRGALVAFCNWAIDDGRLSVNPFVKVTVANVKADRRRVRRAMTGDELVRLLDVARQRPMLDAMTVRKGNRKGERYGKVRPHVQSRLEALGRERALIYKTLLLCGLRKAELTSLMVASLYLDEATPFIRLNARDEKSKEGNELVLRDDLAADLRQWLADKLTALQEKAMASGEPIPPRLPGDTPLFVVPAGLLRIFNRDLKMAGIPKKDDRGRTLDVHAMRTTLSTLMNQAGVAPRTAQAAMRHSDIKLTMQTYTDPRLLDVRGALEALPDLPLAASGTRPAQVSGTGDPQTTEIQSPSRKLALKLAETGGEEEQSLAGPDNGTLLAKELPFDVRSCPDKRKGPLSSADREPSKSGREDLNFRPHGPEPCSDKSQGVKQQAVVTPAPSACTPACCGQPGQQAGPPSVEALATAILALSTEDRARLVALLLAPPSATTSQK